jgi:hypothetical protein
VWPVAHEGGIEKNANKILVKMREGRDGSEYLGLDWSIILKRIGKLLDYVDWIHLAHDRDRWRALVNTVMNLRASKKAENF